MKLVPWPNAWEWRPAGPAWSQSFPPYISLILQRDFTCSQTTITTITTPGSFQTPWALGPYTCWLFFWNDFSHSISILLYTTHERYLTPYTTPYSFLLLPGASLCPLFQASAVSWLFMSASFTSMGYKPWTQSLGPDHAISPSQDPLCRAFYAGELS